MTTHIAGKGQKIKRRIALWVSVALLALLVSYFVHRKYAIQNQGVGDFFALLAQRGYQPNIGFSGALRPGNIIQVAEQDAVSKERQLATPLVVEWADKCFPGLTPRTLEFTLPEFKGQSSAGLTLSGKMLSRMLPALNLEDNTVANYSLTLENTRVQTFSKGDLSSEFSAPCVAGLRTAIAGGDRVEWLRVVVEAIVADALTLQVEWKDNASLDAREKIANKASKALSRTAASGAPKDDSDLKVAVTTNDSKRTTLSAHGFVIVGYRARPLQPVVTQ